MAIDLTKEYDIKIQYPAKTFTGDIQSRVIDVFIWNGNTKEIDSSIKLKLNGIRADGGVFPAVDVAQGSDGHWKIEIPKEAFEINGKMFAELALSNGTIHKGIDVMEFEVKLTHFNKKISEPAVYKSVEELAALIEKLKTDNQAVMDSVSAYFTQLQAKVTNGEIKLSAEADWNKLLNKPAVALKSDIDNIKNGGRNLLLNSKINKTSSEYLLHHFALAEKPVVGETYTFTIKGKLGEDRDFFRLYNSGSSVDMAILKDVGNGYYQATFEWRNVLNAATANDTSIFVYAFERADTSESTVEWATLMKGNKPLLDYIPAPEDLMPTSFGNSNAGGIKYPNGSMAQWKKITGTTSATANTVTKTTIGAWSTAFATLHSKQLDVNSPTGAFIQSNLAGTTNTAGGEVSVVSTGTSVPYEGYIVAYGTWR